MVLTAMACTCVVSVPAMKKAVLQVALGIKEPTIYTTGATHSSSCLGGGVCSIGCAEYSTGSSPTCQDRLAWETRVRLVFWNILLVLLLAQWMMMMMMKLLLFLGLLLRRTMDDDSKIQTNLLRVF